MKSSTVSKVLASKIPVGSQIAMRMQGAYFSDAFEANIEKNADSVLKLHLDSVRKTPAWIDFLMRLRNRVVSCFGLKDLGTLGQIDENKPLDAYRVGDRVGIFTISYLSYDELILTDVDKHLSVDVSLFRASVDSQKIIVSTVVHVHRWFGRLYMFFVVPMHKMIVPSMLARLGNSVNHG